MTADFRQTEGFSIGPDIGVTSLRDAFLKPRPSVLEKEQNTASLGLVWWFGRKQGPGERSEDNPMLDLIFVAATILFFLIALAYVRGCEKLQ